MIKTIGKETIHPLLFYSGKIIGYGLWLLYILAFFGTIRIRAFSADWFVYLSYLTVAAGLFFTFFSLVSLGRSTRLGLPAEKTVFVERGLYRISRNPMYLGFGLFTISSMLMNANLWVFLSGAYSLVVYHLIILGEEKFLAKRFGARYTSYKKRVRRYL